MESFYDKGKSRLRKQVLDNCVPNVVHWDFLSYIGQTPKGGRILDIGTGNGYVPREIEKAFPGKYLLFGIDSSPEMLKTVLEKALKKEKHFENIELRDYRKENKN